VPFGDRPLPARPVSGRQRPALCPLRSCNSRDLAEGGSDIEVTDWLSDFAGFNAGHRCRAPYERHTHQRVDVIWPLEHQTEIALRLGVVSGEENVRARVPAALLDSAEHAATRLVDKLVLDVRERIDFAHLVMGHGARDEGHRTAFIVAKSPLVPFEPMARLA